MCSTKKSRHSFTNLSIFKKSAEIKIVTAFLISSLGPLYCQIADFLESLSHFYTVSYHPLPLPPIPLRTLFPCCFFSNSSIEKMQLRSHSKMTASQWILISISSQSDIFLRHLSKYFIYFTSRLLENVKSRFSFLLSSITWIIMESLKFALSIFYKRFDICPVVLSFVPLFCPDIKFPLLLELVVIVPAPGLVLVYVIVERLFFFLPYFLTYIIIN